MDDDKYGMIASEIKYAGLRARTTQDKTVMNFYANGFGTTTVNEGTALFSNTHTSLSGDTVDNLATGALSHANLVSLETQLATQTAQDGEIGGHSAAFLLVPKALHATAVEITESEQQAGTSNNDLNYFSKIFPGLQVFFNPELDKTSTTAYFIGSTMHTLTRYVRNPLRTHLHDKDKNGVMTYEVSYREVTSVDTYTGLAGSTGAS